MHLGDGGGKEKIGTEKIWILSVEDRHELPVVCPLGLISSTLEEGMASPHFQMRGKYVCICVVSDSMDDFEFHEYLFSVRKERKREA